MTRRRSASVTSSLAAAGLAAAGFAGFTGVSGSAHAEAIDLEAPAAAPVLAIDPAGSSVTFAHRDSDIRGRVGGVHGSFCFAPDLPGSVRAEIPLVSLETGRADLDERLLSAAWLDAAAHPTAVLRGGQLAPGDEPGVCVFTGDLSLHGRSRMVHAALSWMPPAAGRSSGFDLAMTIDPAWFDLGDGAVGLVDVVVSIEGAAAV